jgi:hypothetical protein
MDLNHSKPISATLQSELGYPCKLDAIRQLIVAFYTTGHRMLFVPLQLTAHRVVSCFSIRQLIVALLAERFMPNNHF